MYNQNYPYINKEDKGKKVYKIPHEYLVKTEQYIKADDADQAFDLWLEHGGIDYNDCLLYTSPSPRDATLSRMPSSA